MSISNIVSNLPVLSKNDDFPILQPIDFNYFTDNSHYLDILSTIKTISSDEFISRRDVDPKKQAKLNEELTENLYDYFSDPAKLAEILLKGADPLHAERLLLNLAIKSDNLKAVESLLQAGIVNEGVNGEPTVLYASTVMKSGKKMVDLLKKYAPKMARIYGRMEHVFRLPKGPDSINLKRSQSKHVGVKHNR